MAIDSAQPQVRLGLGVREVLRLTDEVFAEGRPHDALMHLHHARREHPSDVALTLSYAAKLSACGLAAVAIDTLRRALDVADDRALRIALAQALTEASLWPEALAATEALLRQEPSWAALHNQRGLCLMGLGRFEQAATAFTRAVALKPELWEAQANQGRAQAALGRWRDAIKSFDRSLSRAPDQAKTWNDRGQALGVLGRHEQALESFERALAVDPRQFEAKRNRRSALQALSRPPPVESEVDPSAGGDEPSRALLPAMALLAIGRADEALAVAARLTPDQASVKELATVRSAALERLDRPTEAEAALRPALAQAPDDVALLRNLAGVLTGQRRWADALAAQTRAVASAPDNAGLLMSEAEMRIRLGDWREGWRLYQSRWSMPPLSDQRARFSEPAWDGTVRQGLRLLVVAEQGLGDMINFARYVGSAADAGLEVILQAPATIAGLLGRMRPDVQVTTDSEPPPFDVHAGLMDLPYLLGATPETAADAAGYLSPDPGRVAVWGERLPAGRKAGLVWAGNPGHLNDARRSAPLAALQPALSAAGQTWISLQMAFPEQDRDVAERWSGLLQEPAQRFRDMDDTAAVISLCDVVVAVDTSVAHLAGALGKRTLLMLPYVSEWRWMTDPDRTVWYDSVELVRQKTPGDWAGVARRVVERLGR